MECEIEASILAKVAASLGRERNLTPTPRPLMVLAVASLRQSIALVLKPAKTFICRGRYCTLLVTAAVPPFDPSTSLNYQGKCRDSEVCPNTIYRTTVIHATTNSKSLFQTIKIAACLIKKVTQRNVTYVHVHRSFTSSFVAPQRVTEFYW